MPVAFVLGEWDAVTAGLVTHANKNGFALASDEDIMFFVDGDTVLCEDGDVAVIAGLANTHKGVGKVVE